MVLLFEYVVVMVLKFGGVPMSGDLQHTWWDLWLWIKLVDRMEGVDEYHLEAVVFGGLNVAWWEDRVQLDGSSFRRCMKRKSEINNTIETIILKPWDLGDSWNWLFFVNSVYSIINYYQNRNWGISTCGRHLYTPGGGISTQRRLSPHRDRIEHSSNSFVGTKPV